MAVTTTVLSSPGFIVDPRSVMIDNGHQIDWANVPDTFKGADGVKRLPAGYEMGILLGNGKMSPRIVTTNPAVGLLATAAAENDRAAALSGYGLIVGAVVNENMLPNATGTPKTLAAAVKTELNANGYAWAFRQASDSRAS